MKRLLAGLMMLAMMTVPSAQADYSYRVGQEADQVKRATSVLAERTLRDLTRSSSNSRVEIQAAMFAQQVDAAATVCAELVRNRRPLRELRDAAAELTELVRQAPSFASQGSLWRNVQSAVGDLNSALGVGGPIGGPPPRPIVGRVSWRGTVDDRVQLVIRGSSIETRTISGATSPEGVSNFTSPLPASPVEVGVTKISGRGSVTVLQQPSRANNFTAVIEVYDEGSGAKEYRLDIFWR